MEDRRIRLTGSWNFRDIGGYATAEGRRIRAGRLFRSDGLAKLTPEDLGLLAPLALATLIDLRSVRELNESGPSPLIAAHATRHWHIPYFPESPTPPDYTTFPPMVELYARMLTMGRDTLKEIFTALADESIYPAVVHCAAGKDRTGVTVALLLRVLGVPDEVIVADYALTEGYMTEAIAAARLRGEAAQYDRVPEALLHAHAETMTGLLEIVDREHGGTRAFFQQIGIGDSTIADIRRHLIEA